MSRPTWANETRKLSDLIPWPRNPRQIKKDEAARLNESLEEFGQPDVIAIGPDNEVYNGHQRLKVWAAKHGPDLEVAVRVASRALTEKEREKLVVLLHRGAVGEWDFDTLANEFELDELLDWGFEERDLQLDLWHKEPPEDPGPQIDRAEELQAKWQVRRGQIWQIGRHRLMCGDSTCEEDVGRLMGDSHAVLFNTDPPYGCNAGNIGFTAQRDDIEAITKDDLEGLEMQQWLEKVFRVWIPYLSSDCAWYLWHPMLTQGYFVAAAAAAAADLIIHRQIIWRKEQFIFGRGDYHWRHELCFYGWRQGHRPPFYGERNQDTIWDIPWGERRSDVGHPTAKPIELFAIPMRNHVQDDSICAEPFAGSGSQFVAGQQTRCTVRGMEIEPKYCAVTLERLTDMGLEARLLEP